MERETLTQKIFRRGWQEVRKPLHGLPYLLTFRSYWHYLFRSLKNPSATAIGQCCYYTARPNMYAGIGHQMANWIAGYWHARQFGLKFAHIPFSTDRWEAFLGFGQDEALYYDLFKAGHKVRRLPSFDEADPAAVALQRRIIESYSGTKTILLAIQDQGYRDQYGVMTDLQRKFDSAPARSCDRLQYSPDRFNIAVHVRRTVVIENKVIEENDEIRKLRWLSNDYYETVLRGVLANLPATKPISIWIFSTGKAEEFAEFKQYGDVRFCSDMDEYQSFAHLMRADLLITSKSSFSYKPALLNPGIKLCPKNFWHGYPDVSGWVLCDNNGRFDSERLKEACK